VKEREASELMEHFSLLHPLNANEEGMGKKVDIDVGLVQMSCFMLGEGRRS